MNQYNGWEDPDWVSYWGAYESDPLYPYEEEPEDYPNLDQEEL